MRWRSASSGWLRSSPGVHWVALEGEPAATNPPSGCSRGRGLGGRCACASAAGGQKRIRSDPPARLAQPGRRDHAKARQAAGLSAPGGPPLRQGQRRNIRLPPRPAPMPTPFPSGERRRVSIRRQPCGSSGELGWAVARVEHSGSTGAIGERHGLGVGGVRKRDASPNLMCTGSGAHRHREWRVGPAAD